MENLVAVLAAKYMKAKYKNHCTMLTCSRFVYKNHFRKIVICVNCSNQKVSDENEEA